MKGRACIMAVKKAVKSEAAKGDVRQAVKDICAVVDRQYQMILDLRYDLEQVRDEVGFLTDDVLSVQESVQAKTKTNNKRRVRNVEKPRLCR
jgi:cupin superfamily acireductone dioxygenase involved in methionine salvage